jgi:hypothetical protein
MERPALTFKAGESEIRWTYGLQLDLQRLVPDAENTISAIMGEPFVRDYMIRRALTLVKKSIADEKDLIAVEDVELDPDEALALLDWVSGHLLYFFTKSAKNLSLQGDAVKASLPSQPSTDGFAS